MLSHTEAAERIMAASIVNSDKEIAEFGINPAGEFLAYVAHVNATVPNTAEWRMLGAKVVLDESIGVDEIKLTLRD